MSASRFMISCLLIAARRTRHLPRPQRSPPYGSEAGLLGAHNSVNRDSRRTGTCVYILCMAGFKTYLGACIKQVPLSWHRGTAVAVTLIAIATFVASALGLHLAVTPTWAWIGAGAITSQCL